MGAKCCIPVRDDITKRVFGKKYAIRDDVPRRILGIKCDVPHECSDRSSSRCSPSWSFQCDNRTHIEDIGDEHAVISCVHGGPAVSEIRSAGETGFEGFLDGSGSIESFQLPDRPKFHNELEKSGNSRTGLSGHISVSSASLERTESSEFSMSATDYDFKISPATHANPSSSVVSSEFADQISFWKPHSLPGSPFSRQISEVSVPTLGSLNEEGSQSSMLQLCNYNLSTEDSHGGFSSDGWSNRSSSGRIVSSQGLSKPTTQVSSSSSDVQTCGLCSKHLKERASWKGNEIATSAVLVCGHVYHAECLETVTPEATKFDPSCPMCAHGESSAVRELVKVDSRTRSKISRRAVADIDDGLIFDNQKNGGCILKDLRSAASSKERRISFGRSFLRRHFSFGSRVMKLAPERDCPRKRTWVRYR